MWTYNYSNELYHFGVPGMKWGHRKSNISGSSTSRLKKKASTMSDDQLISNTKRMKLEENYKKSVRDRSNSKIDAYQKVANNGSQAMNQMSNMYNKHQNNKPKKQMDLSKMTDQELRDSINRKNLENQYTNMFSQETKSTGQKFLQGVMDYGGGALAVTSSALGVALAIKQLRE